MYKYKSAEWMGLIFSCFFDHREMGRYYWPLLDFLKAFNFSRRSRSRNSDAVNAIDPLYVKETEDQHKKLGIFKMVKTEGTRKVHLRLMSRYPPPRPCSP